MAGAGRAGPVDAVVTLPGSKSLTNRALLLAALADGPSVVRRALRSRDTAADGRRRCAGLGLGGRHLAARTGRSRRAAFDRDAAGRLRAGRDGDAVRAAGRRPGRAARSPSTATRTCAPGRSARSSPRCAPSASTSTTTAAAPCRSRSAGTGSVPRRHGRHRRVGVLPVRLRAAAGRRAVRRRASTCATTASRCPSLPHIDMTVAMLREHGVEVDDSEANRWAVAPGACKPVDHLIEPDLSNAAPFLALAAVTRRPVTVRDWPRVDHPGRRRAPRDPAADGLHGHPRPRRADRRRAGHRLGGSTSTCTTSASSRRRSPRSARWPPARATCAASRTSAATRPTGWPRWPPSSAGSAPTWASTPTGCRSGRPPLHGGVFHTYADHRMAHAGVVVGAAVDGVLVEDVATTGKTFPDFAECLGRALLWARLSRDRRGLRRGRRALRTSPAPAPGRAPRSAPATTTPPTASWSPSTAAATPARRRARRVTADEGAARWAARASSSATGSGWSATSRATRARWPGSSRSTSG